MLRVPAAHSAALRCLRLAVPQLRGRDSCPARRPLPPLDLAGSAGLGFSSSPVAPSGSGRGGDGDSQVPGEPRCGRALLFDPGGTGGPGLVQPDRCCLPITLPRRLPQRRFLSRLNDTAHPLAVYASQPGLLPDHARLASGCWPALPGGIGYPLGSDARFSFSCCTSLPRLLLAHGVDLLRRLGRFSDSLDLRARLGLFRLGTAHGEFAGGYQHQLHVHAPA